MAEPGVQRKRKATDDPLYFEPTLVYAAFQSRSGRKALPFQ